MMITFAFFCIWVFYFYLFQNNYMSKQSRNYVSFYHSLSCILNIFFQPHFYDIIVPLSRGYFIFDSFYILLNSIKTEKLYLYHHLVMFVFLNELYNSKSALLLHVLYIGEVSNIFTYIVYDLIKRNYFDDILFVFKFIQLIWFSFFRLFYTTNLLFYNFDEFYTFVSFYPLLSLYFLAYVWSFTQLKYLLL